MTTADRLNQLIATKAAIRDAIVGKGQTVADADTFASYADKIAAISTGARVASGSFTYIKALPVTLEIDFVPASLFIYMETPIAEEKFDMIGIDLIIKDRADSHFAIVHPRTNDVKIDENFSNISIEFGNQTTISPVGGSYWKWKGTYNWVAIE